MNGAPTLYRARRTWNGRLLLQHVHPLRQQWSDVKSDRQPTTMEFEIMEVGSSLELVRLRARVDAAERNAARHRKARAEKKAAP